MILEPPSVRRPAFSCNAVLKRRTTFVIVPRSRGPYLNFKVVRAKSANTSDAIQKRTITFDSLQPISSK